MLSQTHDYWKSPVTHFQKIIYQKKNTTSSINFIYFMTELKTTYHIELKRAMQNEMLHKHFSKWETLVPLL